MLNFFVVVIHVVTLVQMTENQDLGESRVLTNFSCLDQLFSAMMVSKGKEHHHDHQERIISHVLTFFTKTTQLKKF